MQLVVIDFAQKAPACSSMTHGIAHENFEDFWAAPQIMNYIRCLGTYHAVQRYRDSETTRVRAVLYCEEGPLSRAMPSRSRN